MIVKTLDGFRMSVGEHRNIDAAVPCSVVSVLLAAGRIPDPYFALNRYETMGILSHGAVFSSEFELASVMMSHAAVDLVIRGVDSTAAVIINGIPVLRIDNPNTEYRVAVKQYLNVGKNKLELRFDPKGDDPNAYVTDIAVSVPPEIICYNKKLIEDVTVAQYHADGAVRVEIGMATTDGIEHTRAVATLISPGGSVSYASFRDGRAALEVPSPNLWWPSGLGAQNLYKLAVNLYSDSELLDSRELLIGLADISSSLDGEGRVFFKIGASAFFPICAVYEGEDLIKPLLSRSRTKVMLSRAKESGINTVYLRLPERPADWLLSLCDELGIAVIAELPDIAVPEGAAATRVFRAQLLRTLRRYSHHVSLLLLTGGGAARELLASVISEALPTLSYAPSAAIPIIEGVPALPEPSSIARFVPEDDMNILSDTIKERGLDNISELFVRICDDYRMPHGFDEFGYLTALVSAEHIEDAVSDSRIKGESIIAFERLCDSVPQCSASMLDYYARPKALWYRAARFTRPVFLFTKSEGTRVKFYISNLQRKVYSGQLVYSIRDTEHREISREQVPVSVGAGECLLVAERDVGDKLDASVRSRYLAYYLSDAVGISCFATRLFVPSRHFILKKPTFSPEISGTGTEYTLTLLSDVYARAVEISFDGEDVTLEDNYFDITSGIPVRLKVTSLRPTAVETLRHRMRIRSLYDIGRN